MFCASDFIVYLYTFLIHVKLSFFQEEIGTGKLYISFLRGTFVQLESSRSLMRFPLVFFHLELNGKFLIIKIYFWKKMVYLCFYAERDWVDM